MRASGTQLRVPVDRPGLDDLDAFGQLVLDDLWSGVLRDSRYVSKELWQQALGADPDNDPRYTDESQPVPPDLAEKIVTLAKTGRQCRRWMPSVNRWRLLPRRA